MHTHTVLIINQNSAKTEKHNKQKYKSAGWIFKMQ